MGGDGGAEDAVILVNGGAAEAEDERRLRGGEVGLLRELALRGGDQVRVRGTACSAEGCGAYRMSASLPFVLRGDLEPATVAFDVPEFA
mgnify:CR=1 FL=1